MSPDTHTPAARIPPHGNRPWEAPLPRHFGFCTPCSEFSRRLAFCFHHSTCHVVLSVHQHVFLEGQAPSDVRGTGERQAGDTRYHGKEQESLQLFPTWLMNPYHAWHLPCALVSATDSKQLVSPSQPRHLPVKQSAAWRAELALTLHLQGSHLPRRPSQGLLRGHRCALPQWVQMTRAQRPEEQGQWSCSG